LKRENCVYEIYAINEIYEFYAIKEINAINAINAINEFYEINALQFCAVVVVVWQFFDNGKGTERTKGTEGVGQSNWTERGNFTFEIPKGVLNSKSRMTSVCVRLLSSLHFDATRRQMALGSEEVRNGLRKLR
jgi:hypothetical protein